MSEFKLKVGDRGQVSAPEREAKTFFERSRWMEARERSERLLVYAQRLHDYLHGASGGPDLANSACEQASAIQYALNSAISVRLARAEERDHARKKVKL